MEARQQDDGLDISDSTDWLGTPLSSLMQVEQSLRCHVCKEFFHSPMITSCSHTFCSLCIRRALNTDGKCPLCRATDQESKLRGNWAMREASEAFVISRKAMLDLARRPTASAATPPKRKAVEGAASGESANKRSRTSTRSSSARAVEDTADVLRDASGEPEEDENRKEREVEHTPEGFAQCPICTWTMKIEQVSLHMDTDCPQEPRPQPRPSKSTRFGPMPSRSVGAPQAAPDRLPSTNYSILNDSKLKKKLGDAGIPNWGSRVMMEKRHREWVMIWNANCDSSRPKTKQKLLQDLDTWERTQGGHAAVFSASTQLGAQIKDKAFDGAAWSAQHSDSFDDLIGKARKSGKLAEKQQLPSSSSAGGPPVELPSTSGTGGDEIPIAKGTGDPQAVPTSETIDLTSMVRLHQASRGTQVSGEENANVDKVVSSASVGAPP